MATVIIRDDSDSAVVLAELLFGSVDEDISLFERVSYFEDAVMSWSFVMDKLSILACNPILFNNLSAAEVTNLLTRAEEVSKKYNLPKPNNFMFNSGEDLHHGDTA